MDRRTYFDLSKVELKHFYKRNLISSRSSLNCNYNSSLISMQAILLLISTSHLVAGALYSDKVTVQKEMWEKFKVDFQKKYSNTFEEAEKFSNFVHNLKLADKHHEDAAGSSSHGITLFMDHNFVSACFI